MKIDGRTVVEAAVVLLLLPKLVFPLVNQAGELEKPFFLPNLVVVVLRDRRGRDGQPYPQHPRQRDRPLVHPVLPHHGLAVLGHVGLVLAVPEQTNVRFEKNKGKFEI